jgi:Ulp1 protease family, C-terminal catalytic domain.
LLFPINIGYWTLLVVNTKRKHVKYFDPVGIEKNDEMIRTQLYALLKRELNLYENKEIDQTKWQRLEYERINEFEAYDHIDSSVYIIRQAFKFAICKDIQVRPEILKEYRNKLLYLLFKYGNKLITN